MAEINKKPTTSMGASYKPYNLACRVTEDHTQFHRYNPESDRERI